MINKWLKFLCHQVFSFEQFFYPSPKHVRLKLLIPINWVEKDMEVAWLFQFAVQVLMYQHLSKGSWSLSSKIPKGFVHTRWIRPCWRWVLVQLHKTMQERYIRMIWFHIYWTIKKKSHEITILNNRLPTSFRFSPYSRIQGRFTKSGRIRIYFRYTESWNFRISTRHAYKIRKTK